MPTFRPRPHDVQAVKYTGQPVKELPAWATEFKTLTPYGSRGIGKGATGELLVPHTDGMITCPIGAYLLEAEARGKTVIQVVPGESFEREYELVEPEAAPAEAAEASATAE